MTVFIIPHSFIKNAERAQTPGANMAASAIPNQTAIFPCSFCSTEIEQQLVGIARAL
jgi:hypothetical protein